MTQPSSLYQLIESRLEGSLADFVAARRPAKGWREIADELAEVAEVRVTDESLRRWFAGRITYEAKVAS